MFHRTRRLLAITQMDELEDLRLSGVKLMTGLPDVLGTYLGIASYERHLQDAYDRSQSRGFRNGINPAKIRTLKHLHKLIIQLGELPQTECGSNSFTNNEMIRGLCSLVCQHGGNRTRISILPPSRGGYGAAEAKKDWKATIESGGAGAWVEGAQAAWDPDDLARMADPISDELE
jgi:hypothetical protein